MVMTGFCQKRRIEQSCSLVEEKERVMLLILNFFLTRIIKHSVLACIHVWLQLDCRNHTVLAA